MWVGSSSDSLSEKRLHDRVRFLSLLFSVGFVGLLLRLFYLQVIKGDDFARVSESNRTNTIFLSAPRGNFYDRSGKKIVANRPSWSLMYSVSGDLKLSKERVENRLRPFLEPFPNPWEKRLRRAFKSKQIVRLVEDVPSRIAFGMREMGELLPGLHMEMEFRREYPYGVLSPHLLGYLGEVDEDELEDETWLTRKPGDLIGKMGLERLMDGELRGRDGGVLIEVDSIGRLKRVIRELPYEKGRSVQLTLDAALQRAAEEGLARTWSKKGAAVAMDLKTGAILAWASSPKFDPSGSLVEDLQDPDLPFFDRVSKGAYPPGSVFKIVTAIAGFENRKIQTSKKIKCIGYVPLKDRRLRIRRYGCWKIHGNVDFWDAMRESCDSYFYLLGADVGAEAIHDVAVKMGFGSPVQDLIPGENPGTIPDPAWKRKKGLGGWSTGDTFNMAIGQGYVTATPLQVAQMMATLATRGRAFKPYLVERVFDENEGPGERTEPEPLKPVEFDDATWDQMLFATHLVVSRGTGRAARVPYLDVWGKTGTAQNPHGKDHAWFVCAAGYKRQPPAIVICVFVENGGGGGAVAAPIARKMLETYFPPPSRKEAA